MQVGHLFDLITDAKDLTDFFEQVDTRDQLVARLDLLKRKGTEDFLACLDGLRVSITKILSDTLEMSASLDDEEPEVDDVVSDGDDIDRTLEALGRELQENPSVAETPETPNRAADAADAETKNNVLPSE